MKKRILSLAVAALMMLTLFNSLAVSTQAAPGVSDFAANFASPPTETSIKVRTWWPNAKVDSDDAIREEVRQIAKAGFGCIELICIPQSWETKGTGGVSQDSQADLYGWGTPNWNHAVEVMLQEADKQGILVDLTIGPRWPAAVPNLDPNSDEAVRKLIHNSVTVQDAAVTATTYDLPSEPQNTVAASGVNKREFVALVAAEYSSMSDSISGTTLTRTAAINESTLIVIPANQIDYATGKFSFAAPTAGKNYIFFAYWAIGVGQAAGMTDPRSYVISHWNKSGAQALLDIWEGTLATSSIIKNFIQKNGANFFADSLEMTGGDILWCNDVPAFFNQNKGYDVVTYLPALMGKGSTESMTLTAQQAITIGSTTIAAGTNYTFRESVTTTGYANAGTEVRQDYQYNLSDMFNVNHIQYIQQWCEAHNMQFRFQAQNTGGSGFNDAIESQAYTGVTEGESLGMNSHPDAFRSLAGAANMGYRNAKTPGNTNIVSVELGADRPAVYRMTWQRLVEHVNRVMSNGANQMVLHGFATRTQLNAFNNWPGWIPFDYSYFAEPWNEAQPSWEYMTNFTNYVSRLQTVLQYGVGDVDFAVYRYGNNIAGSTSDVQTLFRTAGTNDPGKNPLTNVGYSYNYVSPGTFKLESAKVVGGVLNPDSAGYRALVIKDVQTMPLGYAQAVLQYAKDGLPIILVGLTPDTGTATNVDWNYITNNDATVKAVFTELKAMPKVKVVASENDILGALTELGIKPSASYPSNYISAVRRHSSETDLYYLFNRSTTQDTSTTANNENLYHDSTKAISTTVTLQGSGRPFHLDPWTGEIKPIFEYTVNNDGTLSIPVTIQDSEALLIGISAIENFFGKFPAMIATDNGSTGGRLLYNNDRIVYRATGNASYDVNINSNKKTGNVSSVAAPLTLNTGWTLEVESWERGPKALLVGNPTNVVGSNGAVTHNPPNALPGYDARDIVKVKMGPYTNVTLGEWESINSELKNIAGRGLYTKTFTLSGDYTGATLDLGKTYDQILKVTINGHVLPPIDQFNHILDLGSYVHAGANTLAVLIGTPLYKAVVAADGLAQNSTNISAGLSAGGWVAAYKNEYGLLGDVIVTPYIDMAIFDSNAVQADIRADQASVVVNNPVSYTVSLDNTKGVGIVELSFEFDSYILDKDSIIATPQSGFALGIYPDLTFQYLGSGMWKGIVKYMYLNDRYVNVDGPLDILKISGTAIDTGPATVTLTSFAVSGDNGTGIGAMPCQIGATEATATIGAKPAVYSKYDLNKDGSIDETDLLYLVYFYQWNDRDAGWDTADLYGIFAKDCDFQVNGKVDLADMIELTANYGIYDPYA